MRLSAAGGPVASAQVTQDLPTQDLPKNDEFRLALEAAPVGMIMVDGSGRIVLVNSQIEMLLGYPREEVMGQPIEMLIPGLRAHPDFRDAFDGGERRYGGSGRDVFGLRKDGGQVPVELGLNPLETPQGRFLLGSVVDLSKRKRDERERDWLLEEHTRLNSELEQRVKSRTAELLLALREREVLLQEVHHRVKNNLQLISSLINMQARFLEGASRDALLDCQTRVQAMALIHEQLYQARNYSQIPFSQYARSLADNVFEAAGASRQEISLDLAVEDVSLAVDKAIPCGLILNELMMNAFKHGFPNRRAGTIRVALGVRSDGGLSFEVSDDGVGLPAALDVLRPATLGLQLVRMLAKQVGGALEVKSGPGTRVSLAMPVEGR
jgi:PAS domain S-box-containing protein